MVNWKNVKWQNGKFNDKNDKIVDWQNGKQNAKMVKW